MSSVPECRIRVLKEAPWRETGEFVVYWMHAARRLSFNFALQRSVEVARVLQKPLVIVEELTCGHRWDTLRSHKFALDGMREKAEKLRASPVLYYPFVERRPGDANRLASVLARRACGIITDDFPYVMLDNRAETLARICQVRVEAVDSNGLLPLRATSIAFHTAHAFRRHVQATLLDHLSARPAQAPLQRVKMPPAPAPLLREIFTRFPPAHDLILSGSEQRLLQLQINHSVGPVPLAGGERNARMLLRRFIAEKLARYSALRNHPDEDAGSGLSPYLHFGHISAHEVFFEVAEWEDWDPELASPRRDGRRDWLGMSEAAEAFIDQLVTWRELAYNAAAHDPGCARYEGLPSWALRTLEKHRSDPRPMAYRPEQLEAGDTYDPLWNAAQRQLVLEGRIHNYVRMLWGKRMIEWSADPQEAFYALIELNNRYAIDGRNPNSYAGISWCFGRYDHPWPERPIFGSVRYMSSERALHKVRARRYLERYGR
ncbi:MAG: deoxyribodipyrimidine photolyase [Armatimonadetes bacterium]|nr:deoxyribodipyrimidine photolyase [Armatimonadota bacterium]